jgi:hypothetical protein
MRSITTSAMVPLSKSIKQLQHNKIIFFFKQNIDKTSNMSQEVIQFQHKAYFFPQHLMWKITVEPKYVFTNYQRATKEIIKKHFLNHRIGWIQNISSYYTLKVKQIRIPGIGLQPWWYFQMAYHTLATMSY